MADEGISMVLTMIDPSRHTHNSHSVAQINREKKIKHKILKRKFKLYANNPIAWWILLAQTIVLFTKNIIHKLRTLSLSRRINTAFSRNWKTQDTETLGSKWQFICNRPDCNKCLFHPNLTKSVCPVELHRKKKKRRISNQLLVEKRNSN